MEITKINIYPFEGKSNLRAFVTVCFDDALVVKNFKIVEGKKGVFVSFPSEKGQDGNYYDSVYPITAEYREYITDSILDQYYNGDEEETKKKPQGRKRR